MQTTADRMDERTVLAEVSAVKFGNGTKSVYRFSSHAPPPQNLQDIRLEFYIFDLNGKILGLI
ncbi:hypothetical protein N7537_001090 [Penicillium hordei]|jgi:hypothetical protein|uniref:Uncharacterized protein n=1 Tax=Penicillium hordei TaxID=40994 RepID=A0AAD6H5N4_9EURO|nr:uncharacterized protein N7537_001090 [Penicillium hordei]KAJ5615976.1 hypothetical protein N7537_001090 [Penicillium hordei]